MAKELSRREPAETFGTEEFERETGYSENAQYDLRRKGLLPFSQPVPGGKILYVRGDVHDWIRRGMRNTTPGNSTLRKAANG